VGRIGRPSRAFPPLKPYVNLSIHTASIFLLGSGAPPGGPARRTKVLHDAGLHPSGFEGRAFGVCDLFVAKRVQHEKVAKGVFPTGIARVNVMHFELLRVE